METPLPSPTGLTDTYFVTVDNPLPDPLADPTTPPANAPASGAPDPTAPANAMAGTTGSTSLVNVPPAPPATNTPQAPSNPPPTVPPPSTVPPPVANPDRYDVHRGRLTVSAAAGVLANDSNPGGGPMTAVLLYPPSVGTVSLNPDGSFAYVAPTGFVGTTTFVYQVAQYANSNYSGGTAGVTLNVLAVVPPTFTWTQTPPGTPTITNPGNQTGTEGQAVSLAVAASGTGALHYAALELPTGLSIDRDTGVISGTLSNTAGEDLGGSYTTTVIVSEADGGSTTAQFGWTISPAAPVLTNPGGQANNAGDTVSLQLAGTDPDGNALTYAATGLPSGLSLDPGSGLISGMVAPSASAGNSVTVTAEDPMTGMSAAQTFNWSVAPAAYQAPSIVPIEDQTNAAGDAVDLLVSATGSNPLTYTATGLPAGLGIDSGSGEITGNLPASAYSPTPYQVTVTASDGTNSVGQTFAWAVNPIQLATPGNQTGTVGDVVFLRLSGQDATGGTLSFSATGLPPGLSMDSTGLITGTIAADPTGQTIYTPTVSATDGTSTASQSFVWAVSASASPTIPPTAPPSGPATGFSLSAGTIDVTAVEGQTAPAFTVGTFTTSGLSTNLDDFQFSATVDWGDGTSGGGVVTGQDGTFTVTSDHTYLQSGSFAVAVTVKTASGTTLTMSGIASVSPATISPINGLQEAALVGQSGGTVAEFSYGNPTTNASGFSAQVDPGDGSGIVVGVVTALGHGLFSVGLPYAYLHSGPETARIVLTDPHGAVTTISTVMEVGDLSAGLASTLTVATMDVGDPSARASDYVATVDWGDGSPISTGTITGSGGLFTVQGNHTYAVDSIDAANGAYVVTVTLSRGGQAALTASSAVVVTRPATAAQAANVAVRPDGGFDGVVATFEEPDITDTPAEFAATIDWGDGTTDAGTVTGSDGLFLISGSHAYATPGEYHARVNVSQAWDAKKRELTISFDAVDRLPSPNIEGNANYLGLYAGWPLDTAANPGQRVNPVLNSLKFATDDYTGISATVTVQFAPSNVSYLPGKDPNTKWTAAFLKEFAKLSDKPPPNFNLELPETRLANMINTAAAQASKDLLTELGSLAYVVDDVGKWAMENQVAAGILATGIFAGVALGAYEAKSTLMGYRLQPTWLNTPSIPLGGHTQSLVGPIRLEASFAPSFYTGSLNPTTGFFPIDVTGYGGAFKASISSGTRWKFGVTGDTNWIMKGDKAGLKYNLGANGTFEF